MSENDPRRGRDEPGVDWDSFDAVRSEQTDDRVPGTPSQQGNDGSATVRPAQFASISEEPGIGSRHGIDLLRDVEVELTVEFGSTRMQIKEILELRPGSVVELDRLAGEPVDIVINKTLIARGEVVVVDEKFAIRVVEIVPPERRLGGG